MSGSGKEWIFVVVFFAIFVAVTLGEIFWLTRNKGVVIRRAMILVFTSNFVTITLGFLVTFLIFAFLLAVAGDENTQMTSGKVANLAVFLVALLFPILLMAGLRRLLISALKIEQLTRPAVYSILSALVFFLAVVALPILVFYFL